MRQAPTPRPIETADIFQLRASSAQRKLHNLRMMALTQPERRQGYDRDHDRTLAEMYFNTFAAVAHRQRHSDEQSRAKVIQKMAEAAPLCDTAVDPARCRADLDRLINDFVASAVQQTA